MPQSFYFTFSSGQEGYPGYVKVTATDQMTARRLMVNKYGLRWSNYYERIRDIHRRDRIEVDAIQEGDC